MSQVCRGPLIPTVVVKLVTEFLVGHLDEGLTKVEDDYVDLLPSVEGLEEVMSSC